MKPDPERAKKLNRLRDKLRAEPIDQLRRSRAPDLAKSWGVTAAEANTLIVETYRLKSKELTN